jgi:hypothetical protein
VTPTPTHLSLSHAHHNQLLGLSRPATRSVRGESIRTYYDKVIPFGSEIEVYTDGPDRRAHARARMIERAPQILVVIPFYLREVGGPHVPWHVPARGQPIITVNTIRSFNEATDVLRWWSMKTCADNLRSSP